MTFRDNYKYISGWIHDYYCDKDGAELIFERDNSDLFECPLCHYKYQDEKRKRAWITKNRYYIFDLLEEYSKKYLEDKDLEKLLYIIDSLNYYSLNYDKFVIHDKNGTIYNNLSNAKRSGRITAQGLNEAMVMMKVVNAISNLNAYLNKETKDNILKLLFPQVFALLKPQVKKIHNIDCYLICTIGAMGILSNNKEMLDFAFNSENSFYKELNIGVTKDYFWFEGSFHYHFFILKPILELLKLAKKHKYLIPNKYYDIVKKMLINSFKISFSDTTLPSPNDGWPNRSLEDYLEVFKLGNEVFDNAFQDIINSINKKQNNTPTVHYFNSGFSNLKNKYWNVFIKYQDINYNHSHPDKLNIEIKLQNDFLTHDLATSGYGSKISQEYYKKTYSHNTIVIDGNNDFNESTSQINSNTENMIDVPINNIIPDVNATRCITINNKSISDYVKVEIKSNHTIDYIFHSDAKLVTKLDNFSFCNFKDYPYFKNIKKINTQDKEISLEWTLNDKKIISRINLENKDLFICDSPDNPNIKNRTILVIKNNDKDYNPKFEIEWIFI